MHGLYVRQFNGFLPLRLLSLLASFESPHSAIVNLRHHKFATWPFVVSSLGLALFCLFPALFFLGDFLVFSASRPVQPTLQGNCSPSRALYSSTFDPNTSIHACVLWTRVLGTSRWPFFRLRSRLWPPAGHSIAVATKNLPSVDFSLDNFRFKWLLWIGLIGCRRTPVVAICSSWCLAARCGRRSVPPKPPFLRCLGGTKLWARRQRPLGIVAEPLWTCPPGVLK